MVKCKGVFKSKCQDGRYVFLKKLFAFFFKYKILRSLIKVGVSEFREGRWLRTLHVNLERSSLSE